jgi:uncharacterized protein YcbK (DUF882 family)
LKIATLAAPAAAIAGLLLVSAPALADPSATHSDPGVSTPARSKKKSKRHAVVSGFQVSDEHLANQPAPRGSGHLKLFAVNFRESLEVDLYDDDGVLDPAALDQLNHLWRCKRTDTEKPIDPHLFEVLAQVYDHFGGKTIELVSGFRNQQHQTSFHFHGSASDIHIPGVSDKVLQKYLESIDTGGMGIGIYPRGGFVHVDVRPEPSYRWVDYSPPGSGEGYARKHTKKAKRDPNS